MVSGAAFCLKKIKPGSTSRSRLRKPAHNGVQVGEALDFEFSSKGSRMKKLAHILTASAMSLYLPLAHSSDTDANANLTCAAYYHVLSIFAPEFVKDLTQDQAVKASFAFRGEVDGVMFSEKSDGEFIRKWNELDKEIKRPAQQEDISEFRKKYDSICRPLLKKAWCDAYKDQSPKACVNQIE